MKEKLTYDQKLSLLREHLDFGNMLLVGKDLFKIVSLTSYLTYSLQKTKPEIKPKHILLKACGKAESSAMFNIYEMISLQCELSHNKDAEYELYGLKNSTEILNAINQIIDSWIPF